MQCAVVLTLRSLLKAALAQAAFLLQSLPLLSFLAMDVLQLPSGDPAAARAFYRPVRGMAATTSTAVLGAAEKQQTARVTILTHKFLLSSAAAAIAESGKCAMTDNGKERERERREERKREGDRPTHPPFLSTLRSPVTFPLDLTKTRMQTASLGVTAVRMHCLYDFME
jgi:hypothetical protein